MAVVDSRDGGGGGSGCGWGGSSDASSVSLVELKYIQKIISDSRAFK